MARGPLFEPEYRNRTEQAVGTQLEEAGVPFAYESIRLPFTRPAKVHKYNPDFPITGTNIILEVKGWFGRNGAREREKMVLVKQQHPHLDFRLVFTDANKPLYKGSKTTYAKWADDNGFLWCDKAKIPRTWLREMKKQS